LFLLLAALTNLIKYNNNNTTEDAAGILADITGDVAKLRTAIETALNAVPTYLSGAANPSVASYLTDGDAIFNTVAVGGEGITVVQSYREYAQTCAEIANGLVAEANARLSNIVTYIQQSAGYGAVANTFAREAEVRLAVVQAYVQQASGYGESATGDMLLADRFRTEALDRRNEVLSIWSDRKQYIGNFTMGSAQQMPS
jgi:hypothetical protein